MNWPGHSSVNGASSSWKVGSSSLTFLFRLVFSRPFDRRFNWLMMIEKNKSGSRRRRRRGARSRRRPLLHLLKKKFKLIQFDPCRKCLNKKRRVKWSRFQKRRLLVQWVATKSCLPKQGGTERRRNYGAMSGKRAKNSGNVKPGLNPGCWVN